MAGLSIYNILPWQANTPYSLYDIYTYQGRNYYAKSSHNSGATFNSSFSDGIVLFNGVNKPYFFFIPAYNSRLQVRPSVKKVEFGDGYVSRSPDGINNVLLPFSLTFDKRTDAESRAILHFLNARQGYESFVFVPPSPFNIEKLFVCEEWDHTVIFKNNNTIQCTFMEVPM